MAAKSDSTTEAATPAPDYTLVVVHPFGNYKRGDLITAPAEVEIVLAGDNRRNVNKIKGGA